MTTTKCFAELDSPIGRLRLVADDEGLRRIEFEGDHVVDATQRRGSMRDVVTQLEAYFAGELRDFDLALAPEGTPFQQAVWTALLDIPYGETQSYGQIARRIGKPAASRAVGLANGANPLPIVIPCHRVIGSNGTLTGYGGGLPIKEALLSLESGQRLFVRG